MAEEIIGLDIGTSSLKAVAVKATSKSFAVRNISIATNPIGRVLSDSPAEQDKLVAQIKTLIKNLQPVSNKIRVGLAENQVFTRVISVPVLSEAELSTAIRWEAEQHIPVPISEVQLDYTVLSRPAKGVKEGSMEVLLVAAKQETVNRLADMMSLAGMEVVGIEPGLLASSRYFSGSDGSPLLLANIGATTSDFAIISENRLNLTYSVPMAGVALTRAIESNLGLEVLQAEEYKRAYGIDPRLMEGKVRNALMPVFSAIMSEAKKAINAFESTKRSKKVQRVVLSGGSALMPGISTETANQLGVSEVILINPFQGLELSIGLKIPAEAAVYSVAIGLAMGV
ncbi:type IV pilus assembly protein PilM [Candidatus Collierbacteria bacterium]|nr:type IV pilus assembly protein PilM [Candidatus Collierbacteria bacterium]